MVKYFADTYALWEMIKGSPNYLAYSEEELSTGIFNLYELYYNLIKETNEEKAREYFLQFRKIVIPFTNDAIFSAAKFKLEHSKQRISYTDALGYAIAKDKGMKFLTGDKEFKDIANVEFIK